MDRVPITPEGFQKLRDELKHLKSVVRPQNIKDIETALDHGDLSENAEYHAAKEKQGHIATQMTDLESKIGRAEVIDPKTLASQDKVVFGLDSRDLLKYGWPENAKGSLKSIPACYLTGYLIGKKILDKKLEKPIVDFGMIRMLHKSKGYGFLKGLIDSGIEINCKEEAFPEEERIKGANLKNKIPSEEIKNKI